MRNFELDERLRLCADFVRKGAKLADVGTDHAYLPINLCSTKKCPCAVASDINSGPLERGKKAINEAGLCDVISTRLCSGLDKINSDECDDIVIAGMGGEMISQIIESCSFSKDGSKHFVLQPMTRSEVLVKWLVQNGYTIIKQDCCTAAKKCYTVLLAAYSGEVINRDETYYYVAELSPAANSTHRTFVKDHITRLLKQANGNARYALLAKKLKELINDNN